MCTVPPLHLDDLCSRYVYHITEHVPFTPQMTSWPSAQWTTGEQCLHLSFLSFFPSFSNSLGERIMFHKRYCLLLFLEKLAAKYRRLRMQWESITRKVMLTQLSSTQVHQSNYNKKVESFRKLQWIEIYEGSSDPSIYISGITNVWLHPYHNLWDIKASA